MKQERIFSYAIQGLQMIAWAVFGISLSVSIVLLLTPCLLPILTLGSCLFYGKEEFFEYAFTSFQMALSPLLIAVIAGMIGMGIRRIASHFHQQAEQQAAEARNLALISSKSKQMQKYPSA